MGKWTVSLSTEYLEFKTGLTHAIAGLAMTVNISDVMQGLIAIVKMITGDSSKET